MRDCFRQVTPFEIHSHTPAATRYFSSAHARPKARPAITVNHNTSRIVNRNLGGSSRGNAESEAVMSLLWDLVAVNGKNSTSTKTPTEYYSGNGQRFTPA